MNGPLKVLLKRLHDTDFMRDAVTRQGVDGRSTDSKPLPQTAALDIWESAASSKSTACAVELKQQDDPLQSLESRMESRTPEGIQARTPWTPCGTQELMLELQNWTRISTVLLAACWQKVQS